MIKNIIELLKSPYPFFTNKMKDLRFTLLIIILVSILFIVMKPFGYSGDLLLTAQYAFICLIVSTVNYMLVSVLFKQDNWTILLESAFTLWNFFSIAVALFLYNVTKFNFQMSFPIFRQFVFYTILIGFISVLLKILRKKAWILKQELDLKVLHQNSTQIELTCEQKNDFIRISPSQLICFEAQQNYVKVTWKDQKMIQNKLLRISLSAIKDQLASDEFIQPHRSFIINKIHITTIMGRAGAYQLQCTGNIIIPISRRMSKHILNSVT